MSETHHEIPELRRVRRERVEQAFGPSERAYLEALETLAAVVGAPERPVTDSTVQLALSNLSAAETAASEKGKH